LLSPGQPIANFEIVRWLGRGAFADVYEARQVLMDRRVALKVITCDQRPSDQQLGEARLLASISHPNIIQIYDCGVHTDPATGRTCLYLATELAKGGSLRDRLSSSGRLPVAEAADIAIAVCQALACAHARGIVHRDIKPENVLLTDDGVPKLADFGVSRLLSESQIATSIVGTAPYIAPEGWEGATHQSDIWAVGVLLYEMLRGVPPFTGKTPAQIEQRIKRQPHTPLRQVVPEVPPGLEAAVDKALNKRPSHRFAKASDLADALRPYSSDAVPTPAPLPPQPHSLVGAVRLTFRRAVRGVARFLVQQTAATVIFLLVAAVIGYLGIHTRGRFSIARDTVDRIRHHQPPATADSPPRVPPAERSREAASPATAQPAAPLALDHTPKQPTAPPGTEQADALYVQARAKLQIGERAEALKLLERCVAADPRHAAAHMQLAILYAELGENPRSITELEIVVGLEPDQLGARQMLARAYEHQGQKQKAALQWQAVLRLDPEDPEAKKALALNHNN